jgi:serine/threonine protein phosphatase PrpC
MDNTNSPKGVDLMRVGMATHVGHVREKNEDSMGRCGNLFVVADGMGGHNAGEIASALAVERILQVGNDGGLFSDKLREKLTEANSALLELARENEDCNGMGTTVAVLYIERENAHIAHIGDSRIYLWREEQLTQLTRDHSLVEELVQNGGITSEQAKTHPQRHILTRALGSDDLLEIEVTQLPINSGDRYLLCTDGLSGPLSDDEIAQVLTAEKEPQTVAERLVELANDKGGPDNITVIVVEV